MAEGYSVTINGEQRPVKAAAIPEMLCELGVDPEARGVAVAVNDEVVPRSEWARVSIRPGDRVEIVGAVQGG